MTEKSCFGIAENLEFDMVIRSDLARMGVRTKDINLPTTKFDIGNLDYGSTYADREDISISYFWPMLFAIKKQIKSVIIDFDFTLEARPTQPTKQYPNQTHEIFLIWSNSRN